MDYESLIAGIKKYGATENDICMHGLGVSLNQIKEHVIVAPWWEPSVISGLGDAESIPTPNHLSSIWNIKNEGFEITYIKTLVGAPMMLEHLIPLGVTSCKRIIFIGSAGSLHPNIGIGDIVIPESSVCGDGASRYISSGDMRRDVFGETVHPDSQLLTLLLTETARICDENKVSWHIGRNFCVDTIAAQFTHLDEIINMGCNVIEMETAVAFRVAKIMNIPLVALFSISDNVTTNKSLVTGRTKEDMEYRRFTRKELFPRIILSVLKSSIL